MKIYFDRTKPFYLSTESSFDGVEVDVDATYVTIADEIRALIVSMEKAFLEAGAPERSAQALAEQFIEGLEEISRG